MIITAGSRRGRTRRTNCISSSIIRQTFEKAAGIKDVISFGIGAPDHPVDELVIESAVTALRAGKVCYTQTEGILSLREKILGLYPRHRFAQESLVTPGVTAGLLLVFAALLEEGEELLIPEPYFTMYPSLCQFLGAKPVIVKTNQDFSLDLAAIERAITKKTRAIIINSPCNPTGKVYDRSELRALAKLAKKYRLWIISDEIYSSFDYDGRFASMAGLYDKLVVLNGYSKNLAITGLRLGYAVGPRWLINEMAKLQQYSFVCAPSIAQEAVNECWGLDVSDVVAKYKVRRDLVFSMLSPHFEIVQSEGAFYSFVRMPKGMSGTEFADRCIDHKLVVVPGLAFSRKNDCVRICFAVGEKKLRAGLQIMIDVIEEMKAERGL